MFAVFDHLCGEPWLQLHRRRNRSLLRHQVFFSTDKKYNGYKTLTLKKFKGDCTRFFSFSFRCCSCFSFRCCSFSAASFASLSEKHTLESTVNATSTWKGGGWKGGGGGEGVVVTLGVCLFLQDGGGGHASTCLSCWWHGVRCGGG